MLTKLGKLLRVVRIEKGESMRTMASKLDLSLSYLSAIENGKRNVPNGFEELFANTYELNEEEREELKAAVQDSTDKVKFSVDNMDNTRKEILFALAENQLDDDTIVELCEVIKRRKGK